MRQSNREHQESLGLALFFFLFGLVLFNWPLLSIGGESGGLGALIYIFLFWLLLLVAILCLVERLRRCAVDVPPGMEDDSQPRPAAEFPPASAPADPPRRR